VRRREGLLGGLDGDSTVRLEHAGQGEFAETVTDHVFGDIDGHEILAVVNEEKNLTKKLQKSKNNRITSVSLTSLLHNDFFEKNIIIVTKNLKI